MHLSKIYFWFFDFDKWYVEKKYDLEILSYLSEKIESSVEETCKKKLQLQQQTRLKPRNDDHEVETINF